MTAGALRTSFKAAEHGTSPRRATVVRTPQRASIQRCWTVPRWSVVLSHQATWPSHIVGNFFDLLTSCARPLRRSEQSPRDKSKHLPDV